MLDYYHLSELFTAEERQVQATVRDFLEAEVLPYVNDWWEQDEFPRHLVPRMAELGLLGASFPANHGGSEASARRRSSSINGPCATAEE